MKKENEENKNFNNEKCIDKNEGYSNEAHAKENEDHSDTIYAKKDEDHSDTIYAKENEDYNGKYCLNEKKIIIYLIILALLLIYYSMFFIHNISFRGTIKDTQSIEIKYPQNNDGDNNTIDFDNSHGNSILNNNLENGQASNQEGNVVNNKDRFKILQGTKEWNELKSLDIFKNYYFNDHSIIAPGVKGEYSFTVENCRETKMKYNLNFIEENIYNINMVYKLKLNGSYIAGNEQKYVRYNELNKEDIVINANTNDVLTIEWKWQDNNNDTQIGKTEYANYRMNIKVDASELED